jgi:hypothetical protein
MADQRGEVNIKVTVDADTSAAEAAAARSAERVAQKTAQAAGSATGGGQPRDAHGRYTSGGGGSRPSNGPGRSYSNPLDVFHNMPTPGAPADPAYSLPSNFVEDSSRQFAEQQYRQRMFNRARMPARVGGAALGAIGIGVAAAGAFRQRLDSVDIDTQRTSTQTWGAMLGSGALEHFADPFMGWSKQEAENRKFGERFGGQQAALMANVSAQGTYKSRMQGLASGRRDANAMAGVGGLAGQDAGFFDQFYSPRNVMGQATENSGGVRLQAAQAQEELARAQLVVSGQRGAVDEAKKELDAAEARRAAAAGRASGAAGSVAAATAKERDPWVFNKSERLATQNARGAQMSAEGGLAAEDQRVAAAKVRLEQEQAKLTEDSKKSAQAKLDLEKAILNVKRDQLEVGRRAEEASRQGSAQMFEMMPGDRQAFVDAAKKMKASGIESLNPMERELLKGNAITGEAYTREAERAGEKLPGMKEVHDLYGIKGFSEQAEANKRLASEIARDTEKANQDFREQLAIIMRDNFTTLAQTFLDTLQGEVRRIASEQQSGATKRSFQQGYQG